MSLDRTRLHDVECGGRTSSPVGRHAAAALLAQATTRTAARIVIVGGGAGGATVAVTLKRAAPTLDVTVIEARGAHPTCYYSNLYLGGVRSYESLIHDPQYLATLGVAVIRDSAVDVDPVAKTVTLAQGARVPWDQLVLSPGIAFKTAAIEGYSADTAQVMPHAWIAGEQTLLLKRQIDEMPDGGTIVLTAPALPYRCPPAPYERACMIAHHIKATKPRAKIILLDAKRAFPKQAVFEEAFATLYKDQIELALSDEIDDNTVTGIDAAARTVTTRSGRTIRADVANIVPPQRAGAIAERAGCTQGDWCPVHLDSFQSRQVAGVYVLGDAASAAEMPKSAFSASSQARVVAADILAEVAGGPREPARYANSCWSMLAPDNVVKIGASYVPGEKNGKPALVASEAFLSMPGEAAELRRQTAAESAAWYASITNELYGAGSAPAELPRAAQKG